jgi:hypothetical protein
MICFTKVELTELSGYKQPAAIKRWLSTNGICFYVGADGWPRVLNTALESRPKTLTRSQPNLGALMEMQRNGKAKNKANRPT